MKTQDMNQTYLVLILATVLIAWGTGSTSYAQTIAASTPQPLTEATLHDSVVTLTLDGGTYERSSFRIRDSVSVSGIDGVTFDDFFDVDRVSDTEVTIELTFDGDFDTDATLTFTVGAEAIAGYDGPALTAQLAVAAITETPTGTDGQPSQQLDIAAARLTFESTTPVGYTRATLNDRGTVWGVPTQYTTDSDVGAIAYMLLGQLKGCIFANAEANRQSIVYIKTEALGNLNNFASATVCGKTSWTWTSSWNGVRIAHLRFFDESSTPNIREAVYNAATEQLELLGEGEQSPETTNPQVATDSQPEGVTASTEFPLTEVTLDGSVVTLTLRGINWTNWRSDIRDAVSVSGIDGVTVGRWGVDRVSDTEVTVELTFDGDFDTDEILTLTVGAEAIAGYDEPLTAQIAVTAIEQSNATVNISPSPMLVPAIGEQFTVSLNITNGENIAGYQATVSFDDSALRYVESNNGDYLPADAFFTPPIVRPNWIGDTSFGDPIFDRNITLAASTLAGAGNGDGTLAILTFEVIDFKASTLTLSQVYLIDSDGKRWEATTESGAVTIPPEPAEAISGDINRDGVVNIQDLVIISTHFSQRGQNSADVNEDGIVNIIDLVLVASAFSGEAAAPSAQSEALEPFTTWELKQWLFHAQQLALTDPAYLRGITVLEQLHAVLIPKETVLLANYPNPFNPETWIPYHLAKDAEVTVAIHDTSGQVVRQLILGHQAAGIYHTRSRAAYWNGRNEFGEPVASGVYFYTLKASDFTATRRMLILK